MNDRHNLRTPTARHPPTPGKAQKPGRPEPEQASREQPAAETTRGKVEERT